MERSWYAVYTRSRHERQVEAVLRRQSLETYLPLSRTWSRRRDRRVTVELPALPGYLFVRCTLFGEVRVVRGPFMGASGQLARVATGRPKLVISVEFVHQAVAIEIDAADVEPCN